MDVAQAPSPVNGHCNRSAGTPEGGCATCAGADCQRSQADLTNPALCLMALSIEGPVR